MQKLDDCLVDALSPRTAEVFFRAAGFAALHRPFVAQSILQKLQRQLNDSSSYSPKYDRLLAAIKRGMALRELEAVHRSFWAERLEHPESPCDWKAEPAWECLLAVVLRGHGWEGCSLVQTVVPPEVWKDAWKGRWVEISVLCLTKICNPRSLTISAIAILGGVFLILGGHRASQLTPTRQPNPVQQSEEFKRHRRRGAELFKDFMEKSKKEREKQRAQPSVK